MTELAETFHLYKHALERGHDTNSLLGHLELKANHYIKPLRASFPGPDKVDGELYDHAVQDAFLRVTEPPYAKHIDPDGFPRMFWTSARNALINTARRQGHRLDRTHFSSMEGYDPGKEEAGHGDMEHLKARMLRAVAGCPANAIDAWADQKEGVTEREIAEREGIPIGTVKSRIDSVNQALRKAHGLGNELAGYSAAELSGLDEIIPEMRKLAERKKGGWTVAVRRGHGAREMS